MDKKILYDIHYHAYDLSHANLSAFLERGVEKLPKRFLLTLAAPFVTGRLFDMIPLVRNTITVFEYPIEDHFLIMEYYLKNKTPKIITENDNIKIGNLEYDHMVICPLMMDFGQKSTKLNHKGFYNEMPGKPIVKQTQDLFNAIKNYYKYKLIKENGKFKKIEINNPQNKALRILPFLGINPINYISGKTNLDSLFNQYFTGYETDLKKDREDRAFIKSINAYLKFDGRLTSLENKEEKNKDLSNMFFGIKLYPPLGFNPSDKHSKELYKLCIEKKLPVTTHCSDTGFITINDSAFDKYTNPSNNWNKILKDTEYKKLKLNFAHFGVQKDKKKSDWRNKVIDLMQKNNIYSDISSLAQKDEDSFFYDYLVDLVNGGDLDDDFRRKLLFGSDFSINTLESESYNSYLRNIRTCKDKELINQICTINPEKFLFDTSVF